VQADRSRDATYCPASGLCLRCPRCQRGCRGFEPHHPLSRRPQTPNGFYSALGRQHRLRRAATHLHR
jgi:hypothetical protein